MTITGYKWAITKVITRYSRVLDSYDKDRTNDWDSKSLYRTNLGTNQPSLRCTPWLCSHVVNSSSMFYLLAVNQPYQVMTLS